MKALMQGKEINMKVTSLILESDPENPDMMTMYHCFVCGKGTFQFSGSIIMIMPGATKVKVPVIAQCERCHHKYLINSLL